MFHVYRIEDGFGEQRGAFETYEAAHARAVTVCEAEGGRTEILRGDELIWDSHNGRSNV